MFVFSSFHFSVLVFGFCVVDQAGIREILSAHKNSRIIHSFTGLSVGAISRRLDKAQASTQAWTWSSLMENCSPQKASFANNGFTKPTFIEAAITTHNKHCEWCYELQKEPKMHRYIRRFETKFKTKILSSPNASPKVWNHSYSPQTFLIDLLSILPPESVKRWHYIAIIHHEQDNRKKYTTHTMGMYIKHTN